MDRSIVELLGVPMARHVDHFLTFPTRKVPAAFVSLLVEDRVYRRDKLADPVLSVHATNSALTQWSRDRHGSPYATPRRAGVKRRWTASVGRCACGACIENGHFETRPATHDGALFDQRRLPAHPPPPMRRPGRPAEAPPLPSRPARTRPRAPGGRGSRKAAEERLGVPLDIGRGSRRARGYAPLPHSRSTARRRRASQRPAPPRSAPGPPTSAACSNRTPPSGTPRATR